MGILVRDDTSGAWVSAEPHEFLNEAELQALVVESFGEILALVSEDAPAVMAREVSMPDGGRADALAVDVDGAVSVCECKLASNAGIRREVVGQVLEYAGWLDQMSVSELRGRFEARIGGSLDDALAEKASSDWNRDAWLDNLGANLSAGRFRLIVAVDEITPTLKQTIVYLNSHADFPIMAVELERAVHKGMDLISPRLYGEEEVRRKTPPVRGHTVEDADVVVVAATHALAEYERTGAYICQPERSFRDGTEYLGFYAARTIDSRFPAIKTFLPSLEWSPETVERLRGTGDPLDAEAAIVIENDLNNPDSERELGAAYQVVLLDLNAGFALEAPIRHEGAAAWSRGQRYTKAAALKMGPATTEDLRAAGG